MCGLRTGGGRASAFPSPLPSPLGRGTGLWQARELMRVFELGWQVGLGSAGNGGKIGEMPGLHAPGAELRPGSLRDRHCAGPFLPPD
jgi:hypothetical protein